MNAETRLIDMTLGDLLNVLAEREEKLKAELASLNRETLPEYVYGIAGIAQIFRCSKATAQRIKSRGKIADAVSQYGRTIVTNVDRARKLYNQQTKEL